MQIHRTDTVYYMRHRHTCRRWGKLKVSVRWWGSVMRVCVCVCRRMSHAWINSYLWQHHLVIRTNDHTIPQLTMGRVWPFFSIYSLFVFYVALSTAPNTCYMPLLPCQGWNFSCQCTFNCANTGTPNRWTMRIPRVTQHLCVCVIRWENSRWPTLIDLVSFGVFGLTSCSILFFFLLCPCMQMSMWAYMSARCMTTFGNWGQANAQRDILKLQCQVVLCVWY